MHNNSLYSSSLPAHMSVCSVAEAFQMPLQWVFGRLMIYLMRPRRPIFQDMRHRTLSTLGIPAHLHHQISPFPLVLHPGNGIAALHIRRGRPDSGRNIFNLAHYVGHLVVKADEHFHRTGVSITRVIVCSDHTADVMAGVDEAMKKFPRSWHYVFANDTALGDGETEIDLRHAKTAVDRQRLVMEYFSDTEIMAAADLFIGSHSNVYSIVSALRYSRVHGNPSLDTCFVNNLDRHGGLACEGSPEAHTFWWDSYNLRTASYSRH